MIELITVNMTCDHQLIHEVRCNIFEMCRTSVTKEVEGVVVDDDDDDDDGGVMITLSLFSASDRYDVIGSEVKTSDKYRRCRCICSWRDDCGDDRRTIQLLVPILFHPDGTSDVVVTIRMEGSRW
jgi:hypothetical protein